MMAGGATEASRALDLTAGLLPGLALIGMVTVTACAPGGDRSNGTRRGTKQPGAVAVQYDGRGQSSEGPYREHIDLTIAGDEHVRVRIKATGMASMLYVWDGTRLLVHFPEGYRPWSLYESAAQHPDELDVVSGWRQRHDSAAFKKGCRSAKIVGHKRILGRSAVGYHCGAVHDPDGMSMSAFVQWRDRTGLLLQLGGLRATSIDESPRVTDSTFSTRPPAGAKVAVHAVR
jgi:hypothetical protein